MKKRILVLITIILTGLMACKKDKLDGDRSKLIGSWKLAYIVKSEYGITSGTLINEDTLYLSVDIEDDYYLEFFEKGKLEQRKNNDQVRKDRIVFYSFGNDIANSEYDYICGMYLNNDSEDRFGAQFTETKMSASQAHISNEYSSYQTETLDVQFEYIYFKD